MAAKNASRSVLITGGTGSVGEALVEAFAEHGHKVTFQYRRDHKRAARLRDRFGAEPLRLDFERGFGLRKAAFDVVVNNMAINITTAGAHRVSVRDWDRNLRLNLTVPFLVVRACLPFMIRRKWGRIVNISSIYGLRGVPERLPYTVTKHGLSGITKTLAKEYAGLGITCNEICPGPIESRMMDRIAMEDAKASGGTKKGYLRDVCKDIPAGRMATPADVATLALFLASPAASYLTGTSIPLDGGLIA